MSTELEQRIRTTVEDLPVPAPDLQRVLVAGRRLRRRRTTGLALVAAAVTGVVAAAAVLLLAPDDEDPGGSRLYASVGPLDTTHGLRAYAAPDAELHAGGRTFPIRDMGSLDTDATATGHGVVFFDGRNRPRLLDLSGHVVALGPTPPAAPSGWHPSSKADSTSTLVALTQPARDGIRVELVDVQRQRLVAARTVACQGSACADVVVDAYDAGEAFVRTPEGTRLWDGRDTWDLVSGPRTRIADARGHVLLYDRATPTPHPPSPWRAVAGAIDDQLTFDGRHVLSWSSRLRPTIPGAAPLVLDRGPTSPGDGAAWWTVDSDGSVLLAVRTTRPAQAEVYDCAVPSGRCTRLGPLTTANGDPMFLGNDR